MNIDRLWLWLWTHARAIGLVSSAILVAALLLWMGIRALPGFWTAGPASDGHHQIIDRCGLCHRPFGGTTDACLGCHGEFLVQAKDSHAAEVLKKAGQLALAGDCDDCHREHRAEHTDAGGLSRPGDFCILCHRDVGSDRPSHTGRDFFRCVECHAYHDNRPGSGEFLRAHLGEPDLIDKRAPDVAPQLATKHSLPPPPDAPEPIVAAWQNGPHAELVCERCHVSGEKPWSTCGGCHADAQEGWQNGRHGMATLVRAEAITVGEGRGDFRADEAERHPDCAACHGAHQEPPDRGTQTCTRCHNDAHTLAWAESPHAKAKPPVTCASCHLPHRRDGHVEHNQSANLRPTRRMGQGVCLDCHGLEFAYSALADPELIRNNFLTGPRVRLDIEETARESP